MEEKNQSMPHNGKLLQKYINEHPINKSHLANQMNVSPSSINVYFERSSLQTSIWWRASQALGHNFLMEIAEASGVPFVRTNEMELQQKLEEIQKELQELKIKLSVYESILKK